MKYRFKIIYQTLQLKKVSSFMKQLDLNTGDIGIEEEFEFFTYKDYEIPKLKEALVSAFEACDMEILRIEGGKIE